MRGHDEATQGPLWTGGPPIRPTLVPETNTLLVQKGWHKWERHDMDAVQRLSDVIIFNYGLHYTGNLTEFNEMLPHMFTQLSNWSTSQPGKAALYRETGEEHVNVPEDEPNSGFLESETGHPDGTRVAGCQCRQRGLTQPSMSRKLNANVSAVMQRCGKRFGASQPAPSLTLHRPAPLQLPCCGCGALLRADGAAARSSRGGILRVRGRAGTTAGQEAAILLVRSLHGHGCVIFLLALMHATIMHARSDCTHFCYTPQLWKAFFSGVFDAMDALQAKTGGAGDGAAAAAAA